LNRTLRIGTRGSALAIVQARWVAERLARDGIPTELVEIRTRGDDRPPDTAWGEGAFVRGIEAALLDRSVDIAVHSAKDVPTDEHPGLAIAAYPVREDPRDALVCRERGTTLATLPPGSRVGTDSPRRTAFLLAERPDLVLHPLHGNVDTRLRRLDEGETDALVLAVAGLSRLGRLDRVDEILPLDRVVPAPGQGALAVQVRADDAEARDAVARIDDAGTRLAVEAERAILSRSGGGCRSPVGVSARAVDGALEVIAAAEREWVPAAGASIPTAGVGWVRALGQGDGRLVDRVATRVVALRGAPRAVVGRAEGQAGPLLAALADAGIDPAHVPAIEIVPVDGLEAELRSVRPATWVATTSANAVGPILDGLAAAAIEPATLRWAAVGEATADRLRDAGMAEVFVPSRADGASLGAELPIGPGDEVLVPRSAIADQDLVRALEARGARVRELVAYRTMEAPDASRDRLAGVLDDGPVDVLLVTSGSTARGFLALAGPAARARLLATPVVASGVKAADAARSAGFATVLTAPAPDAASLAAFTARALGVSPAAAHPGDAR
jgi:hydroxymethylbilane synthase